MSENPQGSPFHTLKITSLEYAIVIEDKFYASRTICLFTEMEEKELLEVTYERS